MTGSGQVDTPAYSTKTGETYDNWDGLVAAEANGYVVAVIMTNGKRSWPYMVGPFATQELARAKQASMRAKWKREHKKHDPALSSSMFVRPLWKQDQ